MTIRLLSNRAFGRGTAGSPRRPENGLGGSRPGATLATIALLKLTACPAGFYQWASTLERGSGEAMKENPSAAVAAFLAGALLTGCAGGQKTAGGAKGEKASADLADGFREERRGDEIVKEYDLNRDGKPDVWKYFVKAKDESGKEYERLVRKEMDINWDGKIDIWRYYDDREQLEKEALDLDFDGRIDQINFHEKGKIVRKERDLDYNRKADLWIFYEKGQIVRKERDSNGDGKVDYWEYWENGQVDRVGEDLDGDGTVDRWTKRQAAE